MKNEVFVWEVLQISCFRKCLILMFFRAAEKSPQKYREALLLKMARILCKYHRKNDREVSWEPPGPLRVFFFGVRRRPENHPELPKLTKKRPMPFRGSFWASLGPSRGPFWAPGATFGSQFRIRFYVLRDLSLTANRQGPPKTSGAVVTRR